MLWAVDEKQDVPVHMLAVTLGAMWRRMLSYLGMVGEGTAQSLCMEPTDEMRGDMAHMFNPCAQNPSSQIKQRIEKLLDARSLCVAMRKQNMRGQSHCPRQGAGLTVHPRLRRDCPGARG